MSDNFEEERFLNPNNTLQTEKTIKVTKLGAQNVLVLLMLTISGQIAWAVENTWFNTFVFDELTLVVMHMFKIKSITVARLGIEILGILLGILFGLLAREGFGYVSYGSVLIAFLLPPMFDFYVTTLGRLHHEKDPA